MAVVIYKGEEVARVEPNRLQAHLDTGWSLTKGDEPKAAEKLPEAPEIDASELYEAKFGKKPHHKMKEATILAALSDD